MRREAIPLAPRAGTILSGKLRIERVIGQGSMGIVLEATDLPLQRRVAVKLMSPDRSQNEEARKRFIREARAAARLVSDHVTRLIDVGELVDGTPYLVMEYLEGATLEQLLARDGIPAIDVAVDWVMQALDGVAEAHRAGFVHRDLKPENLFLCERENRPPIVKVLDFGTVKDLVGKLTKLTRTGSTMGSPAYMAPEQVRAVDDIDTRVDVWAMGVTLYELLTGHLPFIGDSITQTLAAILRDDPLPLRARRRDASVALEAVVHCALTKDRSKRYASATELLGALSTVRTTMPMTTRVTKTVRLGENLPILPPGSMPPPARTSGPEAFAETTDLNLRAVLDAVDASQVRARIVPPAGLQAKRVSNVARPPAFPHWGKLLLSLAGAILVGGFAGAVFSRRSPPVAPVTTARPAANVAPTLPSVTVALGAASAPPPAAPIAVTPSATTVRSGATRHPRAPPGGR